jgi:hypothetical protein
MDVRHWGVQLAWERLRHHASRFVPSGALEEQTSHLRSIQRCFDIRALHFVVGQNTEIERHLHNYTKRVRG